MPRPIPLSKYDALLEKIVGDHALVWIPDIYHSVELVVVAFYLVNG
jgi:hypothetical protein